MVEAVKKSESEDESEWKTMTEESVNINYRHIKRLEKRIMDLEAALEAMERGDNTGFKHENDGGWFE